jgi:spore germination protein
MMTILHTVQQGDTIKSIADYYNIPIERLADDNNMSQNYSLNVGQVIIVAYPEQTYLVQEGDTLSGIAEKNGVTVMELLRNNPFLADRKYLNVDDELIIRYDNKDKTIMIDGFTFPFITPQILRKTLPFLTYITIVGYQVMLDGFLNNIDDTQTIQMAIDYGVVPIMFVSSMNELGQGSYDVTHNLFTHEDLQNNLIDNIETVLNTKGYYGVTIGFQYILEEDLPAYINFINLTAQRLTPEGYEVSVAITPSTFGFTPGVPYEQPYYSEVGQIADSLKLLSYQWATSFIPEAYETTLAYLKEYLDFVVTEVPPEKIFIGLTRIAYDWELPYVKNISPGTAFTNAGALELANQLGSVIQYDEIAQTPYYFYNVTGIEHLVWFKDARSTKAIVNLVMDYGLKGITIWNIMYYFFHTWLYINSQYEIVKLLPNNID